MAALAACDSATTHHERGHPLASALDHADSQHYTSPNPVDPFREAAAGIFGIGLWDDSSFEGIPGGSLRNWRWASSMDGEIVYYSVSLILAIPLLICRYDCQALEEPRVTCETCPSSQACYLCCGLSHTYLCRRGSLSGRRYCGFDMT